MSENTTELPKLTPKHALFVNNYFQVDVNFNGTEAYARAYPKASRETARRNGSALLTRTDVQAHIKARFEELQMGQGEAGTILTQHARANISVFFKVSDVWLAKPLPTHQIIEEKEEIDATDPANVKIRTLYLCHCVVLDVEKVLDPKYSHLIKEFSDTKGGMSLKLHDPQAAISQILRMIGAFKDNSDILSMVDLTKLSIKQLDRLRKGDNVIEVLSNPD